MRAVLQRGYGSPDDVLRVGDADVPAVGDDEVLVRVRAASVHPDVWHVVTGRPYALRLMGAGFRRPSHPIPGTDMAGEVEAVGARVTRFAVGDAVFGECVRGHQWHNGGAFAELVAVREAALAAKPANVSFEQAASVPTSGFIAFHSLKYDGKLRRGHRVLVNGAGGGVGAFAVQIAKAEGAHVTAVDAAGKLAMLRAIGADEVVDYTAEDFTKRGERYDLVLDVPGNRPLEGCLGVLTPKGRYVLVGHARFGVGEGFWLGSMTRAFALLARSLFNPQLPGWRSVPADESPVLEMQSLLAAGKLTPVVDRTFPLGEVPAALRYLASGEARGKIVVVP